MSPAKSTGEFTYHVGATESVSEAVVAATAAVSDEESIGTGLPPLYEAIDPDALDALFDGRNFHECNGADHVRFTYHDCEVTVYRRGEVEIDPAPAIVAGSDT